VALRRHERALKTGFLGTRGASLSSANQQRQQVKHKLPLLLLRKKSNYYHSLSVLSGINVSGGARVGSALPWNPCHDLCRYYVVDNRPDLSLCRISRLSHAENKRRSQESVLASCSPRNSIVDDSAEARSNSILTAPPFVLRKDRLSLIL
jgi:hypothetical protein